MMNAGDVVAELNKAGYARCDAAVCRGVVTLTFPDGVPAAVQDAAKAFVATLDLARDGAIDLARQEAAKATTVLASLDAGTATPAQVQKVLAFLVRRMLP